MNRCTTNQDSRSGSGREVNNLLHTLRGEQFRHSQNLLRSKAHLAAVAARSYNDPSLPFSDIYKYAQTRAEERLREQNATPPPLPVIQDGQLQHGYPRGPVPGPPVPKSWSGLFKQDHARARNTTAFRHDALSLILSHMPWSFGSSDVPLLLTQEELQSPAAVYGRMHDTAGSRVPPLAQICLDVLLAQFPDAVEFRDELLEILPPHFYRDVLRYTAVHDPLPSTKLYALCEPDGHVDGELIVVGPQATLQRDTLVSASPTVAARQYGDSGDARSDDRGEGSSTSRETDVPTELEDSWEAELSSSQDLPPPMHTLIVLNTSVSISTLFAFPLTLTRLALLAIPVPTPVHRLPRICPLLEVLDLSYNAWLNDPPEGKGTVMAESTLERIEWEKWARLRVLGLRQCNVPENIATRVNRGRLLDVVHIVGIEDRTFGSSLTVVEGLLKSLTLSD
ncbi:hypothetical protein L226DRAFT_609039 [Lentinus tigrinus ALCF2SS1-7]|uniref:Uncharacterized protein n=1 Tax=Lentinus tigrinus ALCF2SS1-6 TaxID=1328759 RepID=A0A5C2SS16_9APHY|nr:hypothetical protein L227DRAFT_606275 [Lentinus tigrinus ALCF2SS1-6]RPD80073.1 hypothetical protein L226DRAFT_609039 [Lentinus tigrinus ALCF2SS1-7]